MKVIKKQHRIGSRGVAGLLALGLVAWAPVSPGQAQSLPWTNVVGYCAGGAECPQVSTPVAACRCGLWKDAAGSLVANGEAAYVFARSSLPDNEEARWRATVNPAVQNVSQLTARAGANESAILTVRAYSSSSSLEFIYCVDGDTTIASVSWGPADDNSTLSLKTANLLPVGAPVAGLCIILTDDPDGVVTASGRSSGIVDYIRVQNPGFASTYLENFQLPF